MCAGVRIQVVRRDPGATERDGEHREADHPQPRDQHTRRFHAHQLALTQVRKHSRSDQYRSRVSDPDPYPDPDPHGSPLI
jgi:hypothetical protein